MHRYRYQYQYRHYYLQIRSIKSGKKTEYLTKLGRREKYLIAHYIPSIGEMDNEEEESHEFEISGHLNGIFKKSPLHPSSPALYEIIYPLVIILDSVEFRF